MSDGWLFRLRSNLGSRYVAPTWPSADPRANGEDVPTAVDESSDADTNAGQGNPDPHETR